MCGTNTQDIEASGKTYIDALRESSRMNLRRLARLNEKRVVGLSWPVPDQTGAASRGIAKVMKATPLPYQAQREDGRASTAKSGSAA